MFKKHRIFIFQGTDERWQGDCPKWAAETRKSRPDLTEVAGVGFGPRWNCTACTLGHH